MPRSLPWIEFINEFRNLYKDFTWHTAAKFSQNDKRCKLTKPDIDNIFALKTNAAFQSLDFIANIQIEQDDNATNAIIEQSSVSMLQIYNIRNKDGRPDHNSYTYLSDLSKHGWNMALTAIIQYIKTLKEEYAEAGNELEFMYFFSDRSSKDFSCSGFVACVDRILEDMGIKGSWDFTCPEEGKSLKSFLGACLMPVP